jgi:hypothetical protein
MRLAISERLYQFNFHLIEVRRVLQELGLPSGSIKSRNFAAFAGTWTRLTARANADTARKWRASKPGPEQAAKNLRRPR